MRCSCRFTIVENNSKEILIDFPPDESVIFQLNKQCEKHKHYYRLIGKMPGMESDRIDAILFRQLEFPKYFSEMEEKYNKYISRFQMILNEI